MRPDGLPVARCPHCALWYLSSLPSSAEIDQVYQGYWHSFRPRDLSAGYARGLVTNPDLLRPDFRLNRLIALTGGLRGWHLLDVGCGCGEFLAKARHHGAEVVGNDVSAEACAFVQEHLSIPVMPGLLRSGPFLEAHGTVDIVVMSDVIEHPAEPLALLREALAVLRSGGLLLLLTPNGGEAGESAETARYWDGFRVDLEHLQYFSPEAMVRLAAKLDCRLEHLETLGVLSHVDFRPNPSGATGTGRKRAPGWLRDLLRPLARFTRTLRRAFSAPPPDPRADSYNLFAILRKM